MLGRLSGEGILSILGCGANIMLQRAIFFAAICVASIRIFAAEPVTIDEQIRDRAKALVGNSLMFGVAVGVVHGDKTYEVFAGQKSFGGAAPDENTIFEIGSVTKTFTTLLLAEAVVNGELKLEQPVADLLGPNVVVPKYGDDEIRLVDLATQTSGLPHPLKHEYAEEHFKSVCRLHGRRSREIPGRSSTEAQTGNGILVQQSWNGIVGLCAGKARWKILRGTRRRSKSANRSRCTTPA